MSVANQWFSMLQQSAKHTVEGYIERSPLPPQHKDNPESYEGLLSCHSSPVLTVAPDKGLDIVRERVGGMKSPEELKSVPMAPLMPIDEATANTDTIQPSHTSLNMRMRPSPYLRSCCPICFGGDRPNLKTSP